MDIVQGPTRLRELSPDYAGANLVFLVGCPRSGTTWLQRLLASHSKIKTGPESFVIARYIAPQLTAWAKQSDSQKGRVGLPWYFTEDEFFRATKKYLLELLRPMAGPLQPGELFVEKTPLHSMFVRQIHDLLPEARFLCILRDGRDVVASLLDASRSWGWYWAPGDVKQAAMRWVEFVSALRTARRSLPRFQYHEVRYEELHEHPLKALRDCADFLNLDWDSQEIQKAIETNVRERLLAGEGTSIPTRVREIDGGSVKGYRQVGAVRAGKIGNWNSALSWREKFWTWRLTRTTMVETGYQWPRRMEVVFQLILFVTVPLRWILRSWRERRARPARRGPGEFVRRAGNTALSYDGCDEARRG